MTTCCVTSNIPQASLDSTATTPWLRGLLGRPKQWWQLQRQRSRSRRAMRHLLTLDDAALRDIGVHRGDVAWASRLPNSADATAELELLARGHRRR